MAEVMVEEPMTTSNRAPTAASTVSSAHASATGSALVASQGASVALPPTMAVLPSADSTIILATARRSVGLLNNPTVRS